MTAENRFEIAVVGGALVGAALARALAGQPGASRVALVAPDSRPPQMPGTEFDARIYAISPGSAAFLAHIGAWGAIPEARKTPVFGMRVHGDDGASQLEFDAYRTGCGELAWIVEDCQLQHALWSGLEGRPELSIFSGAAVGNLDVSETLASLTLADGRRVGARLVIGADGARSRVRECAGIASEARGYGQSAVVANFSCSRPHRNVARQWFRGARDSGAVLALLPLPGDHVSMVWSAGEAEAARLVSLDAAALARAVTEASHLAVGELRLLAPARSFPLQRLAARRLAASRVALAGDAAHVLHPLAGQGANLGMQDARVLADVIGHRVPDSDPGDVYLLRRYERRRAEDILAMRATVHGLFHLFDAGGAAIARLRNAGLNLVDRMPFVKNVLMRHAMG